LRGEENLCPRAHFTGFDIDGGFAEAMIAGASSLLALPEGIGAQQAAPLLCAGIIGYRSLKQAQVEPGERLGLFGFGASAHLSIQVARHWGCEVYVFTRSEGHRRHARELGASWTGRSEDSPPHPLDRAILFAPAGDLVPVILAKLRPGGTLAINAVAMSEIPAMPYQLIYGERTLRSVANATYHDGLEFLKLAEEIQLRVDTVEYALQDANRALQDLKASRLNGEAVLLPR
jgi:propanol-preferring alcohol dehydrogenase